MYSLKKYYRSPEGLKTFVIFSPGLRLLLKIYYFGGKNGSHCETKKEV